MLRIESPGVPAVAQRVQNLISLHEDEGSVPSSLLSRLRIWHLVSVTDVAGIRLWL